MLINRSDRQRTKRSTINKKTGPNHKQHLEKRLLKTQTIWFKKFCGLFTSGWNKLLTSWFCLESDRSILYEILIKYIFYFILSLAFSPPFCLCSVAILLIVKRRWGRGVFSTFDVNRALSKSFCVYNYTLTPQTSNNIIMDTSFKFIYLSTIKVIK